MKSVYLKSQDKAIQHRELVPFGFQRELCENIKHYGVVFLLILLYYDMYFFFFLSMNLFPIPRSRIPLMVLKESISKVKQSHWIAEEIKVTFSFLFKSAENMTF